jgi:hypothetical protein
LSTEHPGRRRFASQEVKLLFYGALATGSIALNNCERDQPPWPKPLPSMPVLTQDQLALDLRADSEERNNSYVPGLGYYHSLYHTWYPYPFNYWFPNFGYYRGGEWFKESWLGSVPPTSKPTWSSVTQVRPGPAGYGSYSSHTFTSFGSSGESGISRGIFTSPHSTGGGFSFGGFHFGG